MLCSMITTKVDAILWIALHRTFGEHLTFKIYNEVLQVLYRSNFVCVTDSQFIYSCR
jgi:hypothetical protein